MKKKIDENQITDKFHLLEKKSIFVFYTDNI
jgi:hypothetical protein